MQNIFYTFFETKKLTQVYQKKNGIWNNNEFSVKYLNSKFNKNNKRVLNTEEPCPIWCHAFALYNNHQLEY